MVKLKGRVRIHFYPCSFCLFFFFGPLNAKDLKNCALLCPLLDSTCCETRPAARLNSAVVLSHQSWLTFENKDIFIINIVFYTGPCLYTAYLLVLLN